MGIWYIMGTAIACLFIWGYTVEKYQNLISKKAEEVAILKLELLEKELKDEYQRKMNLLKEREIEIKSKDMALEKLASEKIKGFPWLGEAWADYIDLLDKKKQVYLYNKKNPGKKSAEVVSEIKKEKRVLVTENKILNYTLKYYEYLFPWLADFREDGVEELLISVHERDDGQNGDRAIDWLSQAEYEQLPNAEKYQRALDRYKNSRSKPWQIGRDYERYIGYLYEQKGYSVYYQGIIEGFNDMGRDLICKKTNETLVVQCKCWSQHKTIHEKHINQLFGTSVMYGIENPKEEVVPIFVSSTAISDKAKLFSKALGVEILENCKLDKNYPIIKCNISKKDGTKIYHLPFDQQYDTAVISTKGECYVKTVAEAEKLGFRRAYRWHPDK